MAIPIKLNYKCRYCGKRISAYDYDFIGDKKIYICSNLECNDRKREEENELKTGNSRNQEV